MPEFKRILNCQETTTHQRLQDACSRNDAEVFAKLRVADILRIENSGISDELFRFALQSHFDFLIGDSEKRPLFAVEFDGGGHAAPEQARRDGKKNELCERFEFPLLRINSEYLNRTYRKLDLLTWFVECWFANRAISDAQESGQVPPDEYLDPLSFIAIPGLPGRFPLWLSAEPLIAIGKLAEAGKCVDGVPSFFIGYEIARTASSTCSRGSLSAGLRIARFRMRRRAGKCRLMSTSTR